MRARSGSAFLLSLTTVLAVLGGSAPASQIAYDDFKRSFPIYAASGAGFAGPWTVGGFNAFAAGYALGDWSLCFGHLETDGVSISGGAFSAINGVLRDLAEPVGQDGTATYVSFLLQPRVPLGGGIFGGFFGLTLNGSLGSDLFIGKGGGGNEYLLETRGGGGPVSSGVSAVVGATTLLVVKAEFQAGADTFTLFLNPAPGGPEPSGGVQKADLDLGLVPRIGIYSSGPFIVDEIKIGTTYADVVRTVRPSRCHEDR
jgi:hypothetical protein